MADKCVGFFLIHKPELKKLTRTIFWCVWKKKNKGSETEKWDVAFEEFPVFRSTFSISRPFLDFHLPFYALRDPNFLFWTSLLAMQTNLDVIKITFGRQDVQRGSTFQYGKCTSSASNTYHFTLEGLLVPGKILSLPLIQIGRVFRVKYGISWYICQLYLPCRRSVRGVAWRKYTHFSVEYSTNLGVRVHHTFPITFVNHAIGVWAWAAKAT